MSSITFSFVPSEIIAPGTILELRASRDVQPESAANGVRLTQAGNNLPAGVIVKGNIIQVPTANLSPANYHISVSKLLGIDGQPLPDLAEVSFVVGALKGTIPIGLHVVHAVYLAIGETSTTRLRPGESAPPGTTYLEIVKAVNVETWKSVELAFDAEGNKVDGQELLAGVDSRRFAKFGHIDETLWDHLEKRSNTDAVHVICWPKIDHTLADYEKPDDQVIEVRLPEEREYFKAIRGQRAKIVESLKKLGANYGKGEDHVPFVRASLTAEDIHDVVKSKNVGLITFDDRTVVLDLMGSIDISHADLPHSLGINGTGVNVAIFEDGPSDTTNLVFADRYSQDPPASDHARLTSAIIKNVEPNKPHGYAPSCELYSANSFDNAALDWAVSLGQECTVISQSFHRETERFSPILSSDDILKDWMAINYPYPTIIGASSNTKTSDPEEPFVVHKGFNTVSVGSHYGDASAIASNSVRRNPSSPHSDRELPELCAKGVRVTALGLTMSGTSFSAPAVAGTVALLQHADNDGILKSWPEGCRAILLASAGRNVDGSTWWEDVLNGLDAFDGAGALDADAGVKIAQHRKDRDAAASICGWDVRTLKTEDFDESGRTTFHYSVQVPAAGGVVKVALAWSSKVNTNQTGGPVGSVLTVDLDLFVVDTNGNVAAHSSSFDNSYEIVEFLGIANETYNIFIQRFSGTDSISCGVAWTVFDGAGTSRA